MALALIVRLRPSGPWRLGPPDGARERVDTLIHSDTLFSAVSSAMRALGSLDEWIADAAVAADPAVRFSSAFPFSGRTLLVPAPRMVWPPPSSLKVRWKSARFIALPAAQALLRGEALDDEAWTVDAESESLLPIQKNAAAGAPFRIARRTAAAVDRLSHSAVDPHVTACLEFPPTSGFWCAACFRDDAAAELWSERVRAAFRYLADTGIGGERSRGWGRSYAPDIDETPWPDAFHSYEAGEGAEAAYWLLSLYSPAAADAVDWKRGAYSLVTRAGRAETSGVLKKNTRMIEEGSVLLAGAAPQGVAIDVASESAPHPVYRSGFAVSIPIAWRAPS